MENSNYALGQSENDNFEINRYLTLFISNWYWFAISLFLAITVAYGINRYSDKVYTISSTLLINSDQYSGGNRIVSSVIPGGDIFNNKQNITNEITILKSFSLNKRVIDSLPEFRIFYYGVGRRNIAETRLYKNSPFKVLTESIDKQPRNQKVYIKITSSTTCLLKIEGTDEVQVEFGKRYSENGFDFVLEIRDPDNYIFDPGVSNKYYFFFVSSDELANNYRRDLSVVPVDKDATIVNLSKTGFVIEQESDYLNMLMLIYQNSSLESKNQTAANTIAFIDKQLSIVSDSLKRAEGRLQKLRAGNNFFDLKKDGTFFQDKQETIESERVSLKLQNYYFHYLKDYLDSRNESGDIVSPNVAGITEPTFVKLVEELARQQKVKKDMTLNFADDLAPLNLITKNIHDIRKTLSENITSSLADIEYLTKNLDSKAEKLSSEILSLPAVESKRINIQRDFDINNTVYTYLLEKKAETGIAKASNVPDSKIIDFANSLNSIQIKPTYRTNNIRALIIGLAAPAIIIFLLYFLNNKIIDTWDVTKKTSVPVIGYVSHNENKIEIPVVDYPKSALSESFRSIRTSLKYFTKNADHAVIAITSTISSEGKTFISINLAAITAMLGKKVLLIGLDLRRPRIHNVLGTDNRVGLSTYLIGNTEYNEVIKETSIKNLFYATSGPVPPNPSELIEDERMNDFMKKAKEEFDYIFVDTPPIAIVSDTLLIARFTEINLFIVRQRYSSKNTMELVDELYKEQKLKNMAIIINDINLNGYYGYGIRYGYYKGYGYSYGKNYYGRYSYTKYEYSDKQHGYYNT